MDKKLKEILKEEKEISRLYKKYETSPKQDLSPIYISLTIIAILGLCEIYIW